MSKTQPESGTRSRGEKFFDDGESLWPLEPTPPKIPFDRSLGDPEESEPALPPRSDGGRGA